MGSLGVGGFEEPFVFLLETGACVWWTTFRADSYGDAPLEVLLWRYSRAAATAADVAAATVHAKTSVAKCCSLVCSSARSIFDFANASCHLTCTDAQ